MLAIIQDKYGISDATVYLVDTFVKLNMKSVQDYGLQLCLGLGDSSEVQIGIADLGFDQSHLPKIFTFVMESISTYKSESKFWSDADFLDELIDYLNKAED